MVFYCSDCSEVTRSPSMNDDDTQVFCGHENKKTYVFFVLLDTFQRACHHRLGCKCRQENINIV